MTRTKPLTIEINERYRRGYMVLGSGRAIYQQDALHLCAWDMDQLPAGSVVNISSLWSKVFD